MFAARFFPGSPHPSAAQPKGGDARGWRAAGGRGTGALPGAARPREKSARGPAEPRARPRLAAPRRPRRAALHRSAPMRRGSASAGRRGTGSAAAPRPRRPAATAGAAVGASRARESGCFARCCWPRGSSFPPRPRDELPPSVRPLNAPQAAERAAGSSLPGFVPCDCGGSEVRANGDNASVYPRSPGNPKRRFATELSGASRGGTRCAGAGAAERWRGDTAARQRGTKLLRSRARTGAPRQPRRHRAPRPGGGTGTPRTLPPGGAALPRGREVPTVPSALPGAARRAPRPSGPARLRAAGSCREFVGSPAFPAAGPCTHQVEGGLQQEDRAPVHSLHPRRSNFPRAAFAASLFLAEHRST